MCVREPLCDGVSTDTAAAGAAVVADVGAAGAVPVVAVVVDTDGPGAAVVGARPLLAVAAATASSACSSSTSSDAPKGSNSPTPSSMTPNRFATAAATTGISTGTTPCDVVASNASANTAAPVRCTAVARSRRPSNSSSLQPRWCTTSAGPQQRQVPRAHCHMASGDLKPRLPTEYVKRQVHGSGGQRLLSILHTKRAVRPHTRGCCNKGAACDGLLQFVSVIPEIVFVTGVGVTEPGIRKRSLHAQG